MLANSVAIQLELRSLNSKILLEINRYIHQLSRCKNGRILDLITLTLWMATHSKIMPLLQELCMRNSGVLHEDWAIGLHTRQLCHCARSTSCEVELFGELVRAYCFFILMLADQIVVIDS
ncbi:hypothetical protein L2E82_32890 [Cichorium intybus]|uniref:Uncharacterized protein n=1 Tax=Cichorium intybus TaxID=13427 RepID=A0ACB9BIS7_CICIN|nr:hypothetical protein L2E82_32890 [Cichorium intybus]